MAFLFELYEKYTAGLFTETKTKTARKVSEINKKTQRKIISQINDRDEASLCL